MVRLSSLEEGPGEAAEGRALLRPKPRRDSRALAGWAGAGAAVALICLLVMLAGAREAQHESGVALLQGSRTVQLFERPDDASMDASSWMLQGLTSDGVDAPEGFDPLGLDRRRARGNGAGGLKSLTLGAEAVAPRGSMLYQVPRSQALLGGDDWLGAPLAVPEDVRDNGEQQIGQEVTYWNTHSGDIGTGATYPY